MKKRPLRLMLICIGILVIGFAFSMTTVSLLIGMSFPRNRNSLKSDREHTVPVYGNDIVYRCRNGNDPPIIMLHGFGEDITTWDSLLDHMDNKLIMMDQIGFGRSAKPNIPYNLETMSHYLIEFMNHLRIEKAILMGHSMGSSISLWAASKNQNRIMGLVLFAPSGYPGSLTYPFPRNMFYKPGRLNRIAAKLVHSHFFGIFFPESLARQVLDITNSYNRQFEEALTKVNQPTLILWSKNDRKVPITYFPLYSKKLKDSMLIELPDVVGHGIPDILPDEIAREIKLFIIRTQEKTRPGLVKAF